MTDSTFYDPQWTVLQKLKFIESWLKNNDILTDSIYFDVDTTDTTCTIIVKGTNFAGKEIAMPAITVPVIKGNPGEAATIAIGKTETLEPGEDATVENTGDEHNAVLNFGIPKGEKGDKGDTGPVTVNVGDVTTLDPGSEATVSNSGTSENVILDFGIPAGANGNKGDKGDAGDAATVMVGTTETLEPDEDATVENTGDEHNAVLNFGIPKGEKGDKGDAGPVTVDIGNVTTLEPGEDASVVNSGTSENVILDFGIPAGANGEKGDAGDAATVMVGTTETLEPGEDATVENTGDVHNAVLNFGIPKGEKGDKGDAGENGKSANISVGETVTLDAGENAYVENVGTTADAILNFGIPKGKDGSGAGEYELHIISFTPQFGSYSGYQNGVALELLAKPGITITVETLAKYLYDNGIINTSTGNAPNNYVTAPTTGYRSGRNYSSISNIEFAYEYRIYTNDGKTLYCYRETATYNQSGCTNENVEVTSIKDMVLPLFDIEE